ncbi:hypothetical protein [Actinoallomurus acanthiterrae]
MADVSPDGFDVVGDVDGLGVEPVGALGDGVGDELVECPCFGACGREYGGPKLPGVCPFAGVPAGGFVGASDVLVPDGWGDAVGVRPARTHAAGEGPDDRLEASPGAFRDLVAGRGRVGLRSVIASAARDGGARRRQQDRDRAERDERPDDRAA